MDERFRLLARTLVGHSTNVKKGDLVILTTTTAIPYDMNRAVIEAVQAAGGELLQPMLLDPRLVAMARHASSERSLKAEATALMTQFLAADVHIVLRGARNPYEQSGVPAEKATLVDRIVNGLTLSERLDHSRWVLTNWPTESFAQLLGRSLDETEDLYFRAVLADYRAMQRAVQPLAALMRRTKKVRITGPGTDFTFSIEGIPVVPCFGERNIPDGECFTAPVRLSMNGVIQYNTLTVTKSGDRFEGVRFVVRKGKILEATCRAGNGARMNQFLDTDEGGRYFGEFSLGFNTTIEGVVGDTLFDEKVEGTFHLTPGNAYDAAPNGNKSAIHWDIVNDQRPQAGGGNIYFDGKLVRKNGTFVPKALWGLNKKAV